MTEPVQSLGNHAKPIPGYMIAVFMIFVPTGYFVYTAVTNFSVGRLAVALFAIGVLVTVFYSRRFPLGVQDRVIRLEERIRMKELLPDDLKSRISEFTTDQLIGLRFASDEELPDLARLVLDGGISGRADIKKAVSSWRADHERI